MKFHFYSISFQNGIEVTELLGKQLSDCRPRVSEAPAGRIAIHTPDPQGGVPMVQRRYSANAVYFLSALNYAVNNTLPKKKERDPEITLG